MRANPKLLVCAGLAVTGYLIHAGYHASRGHPEEALWACHVAALLIGFGSALSSASAVAMGVLWLLFGNPIWILDLLEGGEFLPTSPLTHVGALAIGLIVLRQLGWPENTWWKAALGYLGLMGVTRVLTPPRTNVNLAFRVADGWEQSFPNYALYFTLLMLAAAGSFFVCDLALKRVYT